MSMQVERNRHHQALVVVGVLADEVDTAGGARWTIVARALARL